MISLDEEKYSPLERELLEILEKNGPQTRQELVEKTGSHRTTIYDNLTRLIGMNVVKKYSKNQNKRGRPEVFFKLGDDDDV